jgi:L-serine dehydratase
MPAILMAALTGAKTDDVEMYRKVLTLPEIKSVEVEVNKVDVPEVQRIRIEATERWSWIDARNRGGGRVAIVAAEPSREAALEVAAKLGIQVVD